MMDITFSSTGKHWKNTYWSLATTASFCLSLVFLAKNHMFYSFPAAMLISSVVKTSGCFQIAHKMGFFKWKEVCQLIATNFLIPLALSSLCIFRLYLFSHPLLVQLIPFLTIIVFVAFYYFGSMSWFLTDLKIIYQKKRNT